MLRASYHWSIRWSVGLLLAISAVLKIVDQPTNILSPQLAWPRSMLIGIELAVAVALFISVQKFLSWSTTLSLFVIFAVFSSIEALSGATSCGCFGPLHTAPGTALSLDLAVIVAMLFCRPIRPISVVPSKTVIGWSAVLVISLVLVARTAMASFRMATIGEEAGVTRSGSLFVLEPGKWIGKPFPLVEYCDARTDFTRGKWRLLVIHVDCISCQRAIEHYRDQARLADSKAGSIAFLVVPPYQSIPREERILVTQLSSSYEWFVETPAEMTLVDGIVTEVAIPKNEPR